MARARSPGAKPETDTRYGKLHQQPTTRGDEARGQPERQGKWGERDRTHVGHQLRQEQGRVDMKGGDGEVGARRRGDGAPRWERAGPYM